jgi:protein-tyrosine phosphatase
VKLLFVCSGNLYRSPMAERIAEAVGDRYGVLVEARSAGTLGLVGRPADPKAVAVCRDIGLDLADHRSRALDADLVAWADRIVVMELAHASHLREFFPDVGEKILPLGPLAGLSEIPDPVNGWTFQVRRVRRLLERAVDELIRRLVRG